MSTIARALLDSRLTPADARVLLCHVLEVSPAHLIAHREQGLTDAQSTRFSALVARRHAGEPVAYITGLREFFSLEFKVTPAVLIPRPETELLVEAALERIAPDAACRVLDLGTGSGCIAISIAKHRSRAQVSAVDSSAEALTVARDNARRLLASTTRLDDPLAPLVGRGAEVMGLPPPSPQPSPAPRRARESIRRTTMPRHQGGLEGGDPILRFVRSDWFSALAGQRFDVIVANPPYVAAGDSHLQQGDLRFEPVGALAAGSEGLDCIRLIIASAPQYLLGGGWLIVEHGYDQGARCRELFAQAGYTRRFTRADLAGHERLSGGIWNEHNA